MPLSKHDGFRAKFLASGSEKWAGGRGDWAIGTVT